MRALVYEGPERLALREVPAPVAGSGECLVRVEAVGICGSDMHAYLGHDARRPAPLILGHEAAGRIAGGPRDGARVTVNPLVTCGECPACVAGRDNLCATRQILSMPPREGAFAEQLAVPERNLVAVPDGVSAARAALVEPLACGWHAVRLARAHLPGAANALVIGGGAIGVGAALALGAQGGIAAIVLEPNARRRDFLSLHGLDVAAEAGEAGADIVIDAVGLAASRAVASAHARAGGVIAHIGLGEDAGGLDVRRMTLQEVTFVGCYAYTADDFRETARAVFDGRMGALDWTLTRGLDAGPAAFEDLRAGRVAAPKVTLLP